ncbi:hypothetical protein [Polyangium sp. 6x1]|uniref:hypothetical protein n=1 Tax=Polyangium sp. 6x1 TaxID=3042689 RepID=UPI002482E188|nr:hypothetical protein [Polyangium sp. 6x1]MDI1442623.1 hypothetical protein [Polyangium sp. 6x1]
MKRFSLVLLALLGAACSGILPQPQQPYKFTAASGDGDPVDVVARQLASEGYAPDTVDKELGILHTQWQDTGLNYGRVQDTTATLVRRFTVTIARGANGSDILVRADLQRCPKGRFTIDSTGVRGPCVTTDEHYQRNQKELDGLGVRLRTALNGK